MNSDKENLTTLICVNASGVVAPPLTIYKFQRLPKSYVESAPKGWSLGISDSGWMTAKNFYEYFANVFHPWLVEHHYQFPIIVFLDGHSSHLSLQLSKFCRDKEIIIVCLPPNTTHLMQPLDVAVFGPMKKNWRKKVRQFCFEHGHEISKQDVPTVLSEVLATESTAENIKSGFRKCGLVPFDPSLVDYDKCIKEVDNNLHSNNTFQATNVNHKSHLEYLEEKIGKQLVADFNRCKQHSEVPQDPKAQYLFEVWLEFVKDLTLISEDNASKSLVVIENDSLPSDNIEFDFPEFLDSAYGDTSDLGHENVAEVSMEQEGEFLPIIINNDKINITSCIVINPASGINSDSFQEENLAMEIKNVCSNKTMLAGDETGE